MRRWGALLGVLLLSGALAAGCACTQTPERRIGRALGVRLPEAAAVSVADDHGFHGDGKLAAVLTFSAEEGEALAALLQQAAHWRPLPATENAGRLIEGDVADWALGAGAAVMGARLRVEAAATGPGGARRGPRRTRSRRR